jgi:hypothetical protein
VRILVTGSRDWDDWCTISEALSETARRLWSGGNPHQALVTVIHGGARGADLIADAEASLRGWQVAVYRADWQKHGKPAGFIRNQEMVDAGADICLAFIKNGSRGATDCAARAERAGIPVRRYLAPPSGRSHHEMTAFQDAGVSL